MGEADHQHACLEAPRIENVASLARIGMPPVFEEAHARIIESTLRFEAAIAAEFGGTLLGDPHPEAIPAHDRETDEGVLPRVVTADATDVEETRHARGRHHDVWKKPRAPVTPRTYDSRGASVRLSPCPVSRGG